DESVLIQSGSVRAGAPAFDSAVEDVVARVSKQAAVQNVHSPLDPRHAGQIAKGRDAALVEFEIRGDKKDAGDKLGPVLKSVKDAQRAHPGFFIGEFGYASAAKETDAAFADDLKSAGVFSIPLTLIILVIAFGALVAAAATCGGWVLTSGLTVMVAMAGMFLTGDATFASFGYATMMVVAIAVLGSLTVLPALLSKLGDRVDRLHVPLVGRLRRDKGEGRVWGAIVDGVLRRPLLWALLAGGLLLALAAPA